MPRSPSNHFFDNLPSELVAEIGDFLSLKEIHNLLLVNQQLFHKFSSDICYSKIYFREINIHCNVKRDTIFNPVTFEYHSNIHPLYTVYGKVSNNFRHHLVKFKKEISINRPNFKFDPIKNYIQVKPNLKKALEKDDIPFNGKVCVIGNSTSGKTALIWKIYTGEFQDISWYTSNIPNFIYGNFTCSLWDCPCRDGYDQLRLLSYPDTNLVLVCFSLIDRDSFDSIRNKWIPELRYQLNETPAILVGCKQDLREEILSRNSLSEIKSIITSEEAEEFANSFGFISYWETCAKSGFGMEHCREILLNGCFVELKENEKEKKKKCVVQ